MSLNTPENLIYVYDSLPVSKQLITIMNIYSHQRAKVAERLRNRLQISTQPCAGSKRFYSGSNPDLGFQSYFSGSEGL
jgi:hypothetical protein